MGRRLSFARWPAVAAALTLAASAAADDTAAQLSTPAEVRQLVTFSFGRAMPFGSRPSMDEVIDLYRMAPAVLRVRGYTEAESPEPFDLVLMKSFRGLDGFEQAQRQLDGQRTRSGTTIRAAYQRLDQVTDFHRDEFVEMIAALTHVGTGEPSIYVFEWVRLVPAASRAYELLLQTAVQPWERDLPDLQLSETGRVIIGQDWDYLRILGFSSLSGWHDALTAWREHGASEQVALHVASRKTYIVREDERLRVR